MKGVIMTISKKSTIEKIELLPDEILIVVSSVVVSENGQLLSKTLHRKSIAPGDDYSDEDARVQAICAAMHTPEVIAAYQAAIAAAGV